MNSLPILSSPKRIGTISLFPIGKMHNLQKNIRHFLNTKISLLEKIKNAQNHLKCPEKFFHPLKKHLLPFVCSCAPETVPDTY